MSDIATDTFPPAKATSAKRAIPVIVSLIVLLTATAAFGAAVFWSGGLAESLELVGLGSQTQSEAQKTPVTPKGRKPAGSTPAAAAAATSTKTPELPASAQAAMYREQLQSQGSIGKLVNNEVSSLKLGKPNVGTNTATVPLTASYRNGSSASGVMTLKKYNNLWYFFSLSSSGDSGSARHPGAIDSSVVSVITRRQATSENQNVIVKGILGGGFKVVNVSSVSKGSGTATVNASFSGGTAPAKRGQFVCISKADGPGTYQFIAGFSAK